MLILQWINRVSLNGNKEISSVVIGLMVYGMVVRGKMVCGMVELLKMELG
jgi:hypothetical protein